MKKVIERIIESEGAPNENDLWLNGTTLKKFQNGEWTVISGGGGSSSGSMGEDEEYIIAQALNDLNERIDGLQSQVAQQGYLLIEVNDISVLSADELALLKEKKQNGTIANVILYDGTDYAKILAYSNARISYYSSPDGDIVTSLFPE